MKMVKISILQSNFMYFQLNAMQKKSILGSKKKKCALFNVEYVEN